MKTLFTAFFIFSFFLCVSAQKKMTDSELEGLKGTVKSVSIEYMPSSGSDGVTPKNKRVVWGVNSFDKEGNRTKTYYPSTNTILIFSVIDGFKTFKSAPAENQTDAKSSYTGSVISIDEPAPIKKTEKLVPPDKRFDQKYIYEYDSKGRVFKEREFLNNGEQIQLNTFNYDENGRLKEEVRNDTVAITKNSYKYDDNGNLIEQLEDRDIKGAGVDSKSKTVYSDYVTDAQGNWTQRKATWYYDINGKPKGHTKMEFQVIVYY